MSEFTDSIGEAIKRRVVSTTLMTYLFFWIVYHWQVLYVTLFVNQDLILQKFGMLKNEYVNTYFVTWDGWSTVLGYLIPLVLTVLFVWPIPKYILIHAYRQEQRHKVDRRKVRIEEEEKILVKKESLAKQTQKTLEAEIDTAKIEKEAAIEDPTILWKQDYDKFQRNGLNNILSDIATAVYTGQGKTVRFYSDEAREWVGAKLSKDTLAIADTNNLIVVKDGRISLTEKGKFFMSQSYLTPKP